MAGIHADRGDFSHRIVSGEVPAVGLRVYTNNLDSGIITSLDARWWDEECGWYCPAWHEVTLDTDYLGQPLSGKVTMNCERLSTRKPR